MLTVWTKHLKDPSEKAKFQDSLKHSKWILERQTEILAEMEADLDSFETSTKQYDSPNWDVRQADNNGFRRCLRAMKKLNNLDQQEIKNGGQQPISNRATV